MTEQQHKAFTFIRDAILETGVCPSFMEIAGAMGVKTKSSVAKAVDALVLDGFLVRGRKKARRNLRLANDDLTHVATPALMAELERRGIRLG